MLLFEGCAVALITPFHGEEIDFHALDQLVDFQLENGTDAIVACGTTGEPSTMTEAEWEKVIARVVDRVHGRVPVIAGTGGNNTREAVQKARLAKSLGADAQLCVTPYYNKTTQAGLIAHYTALADDTDLPVIIYNVPSRTGLDIKPDTAAKLYREVDTVVGLKQANPDLAATGYLASISEIPIYSGNDDLTVPVMALGGLGVITVLGNVAPTITHDICQLWLDGHTDQSRDLFLQWMELAQGLFTDVNPIPVKEAMNLMGMAVGDCRLPLYPMEEGAKEKLAQLLRRHGLLNK